MNSATASQPLPPPPAPPAPRPPVVGQAGPPEVSAPVAPPAQPQPSAYSAAHEPQRSTRPPYLHVIVEPRCTTCKLPPSVIDTIHRRHFDEDETATALAVWTNEHLTSIGWDGSPIARRGLARHLRLHAGPAVEMLQQVSEAVSESPRGAATAEGLQQAADALHVERMRTVDDGLDVAVEGLVALLEATSVRIQGGGTDGDVEQFVRLCKEMRNVAHTYDVRQRKAASIDLFCTGVMPLMSQSMWAAVARYRESLEARIAKVEISPHARTEIESLLRTETRELGQRMSIRAERIDKVTRTILAR